MREAARMGEDEEDEDEVPLLTHPHEFPLARAIIIKLASSRIHGTRRRMIIIIIPFTLSFKSNFYAIRLPAPPLILI